jgi:hypothetical protein
MKHWDIIVGLAALAGALVVVLGSILEGTFFPWQMAKKYPEEGKFIPGVADTFIYALLIPLPALLYYIVQTDRFDWSLHWNWNFVIATSGIWLILVMVFDLFIIMTGDRPAVLGWQGGRHKVGVLNIPLLAAILTIITLHFVGFNGKVLHFRFMEPVGAVIVGTLLVVAIQFALHAPMKNIQDIHKFSWYESPLDEDPKQFWMLVIGCTAVALLTLITGGLPAALTVSVMAVALYIPLTRWPS